MKQSNTKDALGTEPELLPQPISHEVSISDTLSRRSVFDFLDSCCLKNFLQRSIRSSSFRDSHTCTTRFQSPKMSQVITSMVRSSALSQVICASSEVIIKCTHRARGRQNRTRLLCWASYWGCVTTIRGMMRDSTHSVNTSVVQGSARPQAPGLGSASSGSGF